MSSLPGDAQHRTRDIEIPGPRARHQYRDGNEIDNIVEFEEPPLDDAPAREDALLPA